MTNLTRDWLHAAGTTFLMFAVVWIFGTGYPVLSVRWHDSAIAAAASVRQMTQLPSQGGNTTVPELNPTNASLVQWAVREGGAFVVILVILFFYRRDWQTATEYWKAQNVITTQLCIKATEAQTDCAAALRENALVTHQVKRVFERQFPERRGEPI